jgi:hypothetical protein
VSDPEVRAWATARGMKVGARGVIPAEVREASAAEAALDGGGGGDAWAGDDAGPDGVTGLPDPFAGLWPDNQGVAQAAAPPPDPADMAEAVPGAVPARGGSRSGRRLGFPGRKAPAKGKGRARAKKPRVPVDRLIGDVWRGLAGFAKPLPATSRLLTLQAPLAGLMFEEAIKNTVMDSVLQPFARTGKNAELIWAMLGAPALTIAIQLRPGEMAFMLPMLRSALVTMVRVAGPRMTEALQEEAEFEKTYGDTVDAMIVFLLQGVAVPEDQTEEQAEAETIRILHQEMSGTAAA